MCFFPGRAVLWAAALLPGHGTGDQPRGFSIFEQIFERPAISDISNSFNNLTLSQGAGPPKRLSIFHPGQGLAEAAAFSVRLPSLWTRTAVFCQHENYTIDDNSPA